MSERIESVLQEARSFEPSEEFRERAKISDAGGV